MNKVPLGQKIKIKENKWEKYFKKQVERVLEKVNTVHSQSIIPWKGVSVMRKTLDLNSCDIEQKSNSKLCLQLRHSMQTEIQRRGEP